MKKYYGKEKCRILKEIRAEIAKQNDIEWVVSECKHQGDCRGTCPKCEAEVRELERALARREAMGKTVAVVGISAGLALSVTGCDTPLFQTQGHMEDKSMSVTDKATETEVIVEMGDMVMDTDTALETDDATDDWPVPGEDLMGEPIMLETETDTDDPQKGTDAWSTETDIGVDGEMYIPEDEPMGDPVVWEETE